MILYEDEKVLRSGEKHINIFTYDSLRVRRSIRVGGVAKGISTSSHVILYDAEKVLGGRNPKDISTPSHVGLYEAEKVLGAENTSISSHVILYGAEKVLWGSKRYINIFTCCPLCVQKSVREDPGNISTT